MACGYQHQSNGHVLRNLLCEGSPFVSQPQRFLTPSRRQPLYLINGLVHHNHSFAQLGVYFNQPLPLNNYNQVLLITIPPPKLIKPVKPHQQPLLPPHPLLGPIRLLGDLTISITDNTLPNKSPESNLKIRLGQLSSIQIVTSDQGLTNNNPQSLQSCNGSVNEMEHKRPKRCRSAT